MDDVEIQDLTPFSHDAVMLSFSSPGMLTFCTPANH